MAPYKRNFTTPKENFTSIIEATSIRTILYTIVTIVLRSFPNARKKKLLYLSCKAMILLLLNIMTIVICVIAGTS